MIVERLNVVNKAAFCLLKELRYMSKLNAGEIKIGHTGKKERM